jgi:anthranilate phosphoribosyltransferase
MLKRFLEKVIERKDLTEGEAEEAMGLIMEGRTLPTQIASFLTALRMKGETREEITGFARAMRAKGVQIQLGDGRCVVDTCGTGGDGIGTFNISTAVAFVAAGAGLAVAKHGNRSISSRCGSADVLEALGVNINLSIERVQGSLEQIGFAFLFAPLFHPAMKHALTPRKEIGIRTVFNLLGPLTNPAGATAQVVGVYRRDLTHPIAEVLKNLGCQGAFVVHGEDRSDEMSITGKTFISELKHGTIKDYSLEPEEVGLKNANLEAIRGGTPEINAEILRRVLEGECGPHRDVVMLNASAIFVATEKVSSLRDGIEMAKESIDSGRAMKKLNDLVQFTKKED